MAEKTLSFEETMQQLEDILQRLSQPEVTLDESLVLYAKAADYVQQCNEKLASAEIRIREIGEKLEEDGSC